METRNYQKVKLDRIASDCSRKASYTTEGHAKNAIARIENERGVVLYFYACKWCGGYHLTKREPKS